MSEGKHVRPRRTRGVRLFGGRGRRRRTLDWEQPPPTRRELARDAERATASQARSRMAWAALGALAIVAAAVAATTFLLRPSEGSGARSAGAGGEGSSLLAVVANASGRAASVTLVAVPSAGPAQAVLFPPSLLVTLPGYGSGPLRDAPRFGGGELAELTVMNLLGARVDVTALYPRGAVTAALAEPLEIDLSVPLVEREAEGERVTAADGPASRRPAIVEALLSRQGTGDQIEWLRRQGDVWRALLVEASRDAELAGSMAGYSAVPGLAREVLERAAAGRDLLVTAVPATRIAVGGETERYQLSGDEAAAFVRDRLGFLQLREEPRPRVEVLNGNGRLGTTQAVARALIEDGFRVVKTDNADRFDYPATQVISQGREHQEAAVEALGLLGRGEVILELRRPSGVVDLTIIVGRDIPAEEES